MIVRKIKPEEIERTQELFHICFNVPYNNKETSTSLYQTYTEAPKNREQEHCLERVAAFLDDNRTMMSNIIMQPFEVCFDQQVMLMFSIGGVATLPQYRRMGGIRACFELLLPYLYEKGVAFSYLYPFSTAYYRKFGYELCSKKKNYHVELSHIPNFKERGDCYLLEEHTRELAEKDIPLVYKKWQETYNMMVQWNHYDYQEILKKMPLQEQSYTYIYRNEEGVATGFMVLTCEKGECQKLVCSQFFYTERGGMRGLLMLAKSLAADYRQIVFSLPMDFDLEQILPEWSMGAIDCEVAPQGMVRVIQVEKVLEKASYLGSGSIVMEIADCFIDANNGVFEISFRDGICNKIEKTKKQPDVSLGIAAFSALITGVYGFETYRDWDGIKIFGNEEELKKVFYKKPIYICNYF